MYLRCTVSVSKHTHTHTQVVYLFVCCCLCFVIVYFDLVLFCPVSLLYLKPLFSRVTLVLAGSCAASAALIRVAGRGHDCKLYVQYSVCLFVCIHFIFLPSALVRLTPSTLQQWVKISTFKYLWQKEISTNSIFLLQFSKVTVQPQLLYL